MWALLSLSVMQRFSAVARCPYSPKNCPIKRVSQAPKTPSVYADPIMCALQCPPLLSITSQGLLILLITSSNFPSSTSFSLTATLLFSSSATNSCSNFLILSCCSSVVFSSPGKLDISSSICCSRIIRSLASSRWPSSKSLAA